MSTCFSTGGRATTGGCGARITLIFKRRRHRCGGVWRTTYFPFDPPFRVCRRCGQRQRLRLADPPDGYWYWLNLPDPGRTTPPADVGDEGCRREECSPSSQSTHSQH